MRASDGHGQPYRTAKDARRTLLAIRTKFVVLFAVVIVAMLMTTTFWQHHVSEQNTERELVEQARALSANMDAVWHFMTINQDLINYDSSGHYEFKGLQCSIVGKSVGVLFSRVTDYRTNYVALTPRNVANAPDDFERAGLEAFAADKTLTELYANEDSEEGSFFRYLRRMDIEASCLECHGEPAGEMDESGYPKEGLAVGDLYGAVSLSVPRSTYEQAMRTSMVQSVLLSVCATLVCVAVIWVAISKLVVGPIDSVRTGMERFEGGDYTARIPPDGSSRELQALVSGFNDMAHELQESHSELENTVEMRTQQLRRANERLEEQRRMLAATNDRLANENQYKSDFLAMVSHELKTPLAASMAFSSILKERAACVDEDEERMWQELEANNQALLSLINNILEMARIEAGKEELHLELVDAAEVVYALQSSIDPLAAKKGIRVVYDVDDGIPLFAADAEKLHRVAENLAGNAVKFTDAGGEIRLSCAYDASTRQVVMGVADTGIGISPDDCARIFEKFTQADGSISRSYGGSGLGLAMCKELVELHGGSITVDSSPGAGSTFTVRIPADLPL